MARLGDVGKIITGNTPNTSYEKNYESNDICFIKPSDISDSEVTRLSSSEFHISEYARKKARILPPRSVLVTCIGIIGKVAINAIECAFNQQINAIIPDESKCTSEYLAYEILYKQDELRIIANSPVVPIINKTQFSDIEVRLPLISEQRRVTNKLKKVDMLLSLRKQQLAKLDELVKSRFVEMFGENIDCSEKAFLEDISEFVTVGIANSATHAYSDNVVVMLRNQNIKENYLDDADLIHITPEFAEKYGSKQLEENDILVIRTGYPGIACLVPRKYAGCQTFTTLIVRLKDSSRIHANYVCHYINSSFGKEYVELSKVGVAQQNFGAKALAKMPIRIPSLGMQEEFSAFIEQTDKSKLAVKQTIEKLETLKKSLMQQYFG